ncbi:hypothetical protein KL905_005385 [Ogataea polymorpha]|nr:hypothetical protein KL937_005395 [Ogataea polymorpha]KAG7896605.1 hypothetical protein KL908_000007 [Ogataea polymorpha]KAG7913624.1 hypothetical protein KL907_000569 [Ogataea polymorpha]KAG7914320.1 hypothetical protein KL905_005385 [Ogataea polymorpha]KAG7930719.1 hypothetical protein KL904_005353 [Ogataea polymorpha]
MARDWRRLAFLRSVPGWRHTHSIPSLLHSLQTGLVSSQRFLWLVGKKITTYLRLRHSPHPFRERIGRPVELVSFRRVWNSARVLPAEFAGFWSTRARSLTVKALNIRNR